MEQVPGKDNRGALLYDTLEGARAMHHENVSAPLNVARYSRFYQLEHKDAMGFKSRRRGFEDRSMWAAMTTQPQVSPRAARFKKEDLEQRWSYAIPLEIVYLTPLTKWNPYGIRDATAEAEAAGLDKPARKQAEAVVTAGGTMPDGSVPKGGRNGRCDQGPGMAYNGARRSLYYRTPVEFFAAGRGEAGADDPADTTGSGATCVLDPSGTVRRVRASGHNVFVPAVGGGVGGIRQRYPIMPIHEDGNTAWKEIKALAALTLDTARYEHDHASPVFGDDMDARYGFNLVLTGGGHDHNVHISASRVAKLEQRLAEKGFARATVPTEERDGHQHLLQITRDRAGGEEGTGPWVYSIVSCGTGGRIMDGRCEDGHTVLVRPGAE